MRLYWSVLNEDQPVRNICLQLRILDSRISLYHVSVPYLFLRSCISLAFSFLRDSLKCQHLFLTPPHWGIGLWDTRGLVTGGETN